ncbi:hypothetical protein C2845_PM12G13410 [Panicum miliaceum]|uniref:Uncharacterized protein n=1 Tax=Panicum miliaceum TaxID=4540 RepID=A0A3L6QLY3_PANMI|nr:hypothetical protein C2845_PM12G13410 [Panicum miliaceum]
MADGVNRQVAIALSLQQQLHAALEPNVNASLPQPRSSCASTRHLDKRYIILIPNDQTSRSASPQPASRAPSMNPLSPPAAPQHSPSPSPGQPPPPSPPPPPAKKHKQKPKK